MGFCMVRILAGGAALLLVLVLGTLAWVGSSDMQPASQLVRQDMADSSFPR